MLVKCKPVYNFQSVEFEMEINNKEDMKKMFETFGDMIEGLKSVAPEQPAQPKATPVKQEPKATPKQVSCLIKLGIDEETAKRMTMSEANKKINELING